MSDQIPIVEAFRMMAANKSLTELELHDLIREGIHAALARRFGGPVEAEIDVTDGGDISIVVLKEVVEEVEDAAREVTLEQARWDDPDFQVGDLMEIPVDFRDFGRSAVMAAKQRIIQRIREGERDRIRMEFNDRVGDLVSGEVQASERGKLVVMLNRSREAEAIIPWREQNPRERFRQGEPIRAVLKLLEETPRGPRLILSRADPQFVASLFALEVPEIYQNIVDIKEIVREAGGRTKVAVASRDESVDPVGACVGLKGSRVQAVVSELSGERIDIVPWHPDPEIFARRALAPARVAKVISDQERHVITAIVDEDQLSLAIGRNGQNVRLASQLIGWQIDLYSSRDWMERGGEAGLFGGDEEYEMSDFPLSELEGIAPATLAALEAAGVGSFYGLLDMDRSDFLQVPGIGPDEADTLEALIDELTVVDEAQAEGAAGKAAAEASTETEVAEAEVAEAEAPELVAPEPASADAADAMSTAASGEGTA
ncbi:transcription termination factor NusA [Candidatus Palauibacter soopunensis]|uniref:transcription termination factor NusA n=1 Tax=Candidatus Palauibacter soopunensis TaxID=3056739 RepID=UPI002386674B|nr:transcription termination factor NusA [Candidatus Palauibacter soopunensis]MDE2879796.1 transcription termination factor NusA [Candidatus Palauibacter soopunensis]